MVAIGGPRSGEGYRAAPVTGRKVELYGTSVLLSDAQIKALPTGLLEVVPAPGPGKAAIFVAAILALDTRAGVYNTGGSDFTLRFDYMRDGVPIDAASNEYDETLNHAFTLDINGDPGTFLQMMFMPPMQEGGSAKVTHAAENASLALDLAGGVNLNEGHPANTLKVTVFYTVLDL
jgi:hypothetical protein